MRQIQKNSEPHSLTQFRAAFQSDPNFGYGLIDTDLRGEIRRALVLEQRSICAYTGRRIDEHSCHIEHLKPQVHCRNGEDVLYSNMVACVPAPNAPRLPYGAHRKGSWPDPAQTPFFVSPLHSCEARFSFTIRGEIQVANNSDQAARETIARLGLDHSRLTQLRKAAIDATLGVHPKGPGSLDLAKARKRLAGLIRAESTNGALEPFCFALKQALEKHIKRLEAIQEQKRIRS